MLAAPIAALLLSGCIPKPLPPTAKTGKNGNGSSVASTTAAPTMPSTATVRQSLNQTIIATLTGLAGKSTPSDPRFFAQGVWFNDGTPCFRCDAGPGVAAAAIAAGEGNPWALNLALQTFDVAIAKNRNKDGSFGPPSGGETNPDIQTALFGNELGTAYLLLLPRLGSQRAAVWKSAMIGTSDWLIKNGNLQWYTNGNIVLANALNMALTARITGDPKYEAAYQQAMSFAISPGNAQWKGDGLVVTKTPTIADGSNGAGYLTEKGLGSPGFDADYTQMQLNVATRLYLVSRDPKALWLANLFMNQLLPRVDMSDWLLDTSLGSRHPDAVRHAPFTNSAVTLLALDDHRPDMESMLSSQIANIGQFYRSSIDYTNVANYYSLGDELATAYMTTAGLLP